MIKINKINGSAKSKNTKIFKKSVAIAIAATTIGSLVGCSEGKALLDGTILDSCVVALVDGKPEILKNLNDNLCVDIKGHFINDFKHDHYQNIISDEYLTTYKNCYKISENLSYSPVRYIENIQIEGSVHYYLDKSEMKKADENELSNADVINIYTRIKESYNENNKKMVKTK